MATARYSSIWDRWCRDETNLSPAQWEAWLQTNYPATIERDASGGYVSEHGNPRSWGICPATLAEVVWLYLRNIVTATQARETFSMSDHESLQMGDVLAWIQAGGTVQAQIQRHNDLQCLMDMVEQRAIISKSYIYTMMSIRADATG